MVARENSTRAAGQSGARVRSLNSHPVLNTILAAIPEGEFGELRPHLEFQDLPAARVLHEPDAALTHAYFLNSGLASLIVPTSEGRNVEVGVVGSAGFVGIPLLCGVGKTLVRTAMQVSGSGFRINADALVKMVERTPELERRMRHYVLLEGMQIAQTAACNRLHELEQRLARWLLATADRVGPEFAMTQEHLAQMLGTGRASLSVVASRIRKAGIIHYSRGIVRIVNRERLEQFSCECYAAVRQFQQELWANS